MEAPAELQANLCDCSICAKSGYVHLIVPVSRFRLLQGADNLAMYKFNTRTAKHFFCKTCGVKSFYVPRSDPDGYSVNVRCLNASTIESVSVTHVDGKNWELHAYELAHLSKDVAK